MLKRKMQRLVQLDVSRETQEKLRVYEALLNKWQTSINLVAPSTLADSRVRHIEDSLQLVSHLPPSARSLCDFGSGAGFPALVVAIARPKLQVTLIESDQRKCAFLKTVSRETGCTNVNVITSRIESLSDYSAFDFFSARALAPLTDLFSYMEMFSDFQASTAFFLKGESVKSEIEEAEKIFAFEYLLHTSKTHSTAFVVEVRHLMRKCA